jgi:hypothetical protein
MGQDLFEISAVPLTSYEHGINPYYTKPSRIVMLERHENHKSPVIPDSVFADPASPAGSRDFNNLLDPGMRRHDGMWLTGQH